MAVEFFLNTNDSGKTGKKNGYPGQRITETLTNGFFTVDQKWIVKYWNKAAEKLLGVQATDIVGKNLWGKFAGAIPLEFYSVYYKAFLQNTPVHFEEYWGEMGAWFDVVTYHCDNTLFVSFKSSNQPYSEYPQHPLQRLKTLTELYKLVTEITNDCLWEWDLQTKELFWIDGGHKRVFGYPIENALIPYSFWEGCLHPDDKTGVLARLNHIITEESGPLWEDEYRFKKYNGDYAHVHVRGHIIYEEGKASRMIGATQDITEKVLLGNKLVQERVTKQREITEAILTAQEHERTDIGQELHDNLNQILAVTKMYLQMAKMNTLKGKIYLDKSCDNIEKVIEDIRKIARHLVIPPVHIIGLFDNIKNLLADLVKINPIKIDFHTEGIKEDDMDEKLQVNIFRIVQEQLNNILKHSKATRAGIRINRHENEIVLLISDNGQGLDTAKEKNGVGIINIKSRADLFQGNVAITSKPGEGYELRVVLQLGDNRGIKKPGAQ